VPSDPPDPTRARSVDDLATLLRQLKIWAGDPSYATIAGRINEGRTARTTVADCFRPGRRRPAEALVLGIVSALNPDLDYVDTWRTAFRAVREQDAAAAFASAGPELPDEDGPFVGRERELAAIVECAGTAVFVVEGMPGVGKTRLAVRAARLLRQRRRFDHVLYLDLRGFHPNPGLPPVSTAAAVGAVLRAIGVPARRIPYAPHRRAQLCLDRLRDRSVLMVLDDVASVGQITPLLAAARSGVAIVTSRQRLARPDGSHRLMLDVLSPDQASELLGLAVGAARVAAEREAADRIGELCGWHPLALSLTASRISSAPGWSLADHRDRLDAQHRRGHLDEGLQTSLRLSYDGLDAPHQALLRGLAAHPGPDLDAAAAAALIGADPDEGLEHLVRVHLLHGDAGRYRLHDVVRVFAAERALDADPPGHRRHATSRLRAHYLAGVTAAVEMTRRLDSRAEAIRWLDAELPNVLATAVHAQADEPQHTARLALTLHPYLLRSGHLGDLLALDELGLAAARRSGQPQVIARATYHLGAACVRAGRYRHGAEHLGHAVALFGRAGDRAGEADALHYLGLAERQLGDHRRAAELFERARALRCAIGDRHGEARALVNLGILCQVSGRYRQATAHHKRALALFGKAGQPTGEALALQNLGVVRHLGGAPRQALRHLRDAIARYSEHGDDGGRAHALADLGSVHSELGEHDQAIALLDTAIAVAEDRGDGYVAAYTTNAAGVVHRRLGRTEQALRLHRTALDFYRESADPIGQTEAFNGLAEAQQAAGDTAAALRTFTRALELATRIGAQLQLTRARAGITACERPS